MKTPPVNKTLRSYVELDVEDNPPHTGELTLMFGQLAMCVNPWAGYGAKDRNLLSGGSKYKMISANELGKAYEDNLVKFVGKTLPNDLTVLEHGVRNLKKQISLDKSQPDSLRKEMQAQLAIPLKHKQAVVIEMDNSDDAPL